MKMTGGLQAAASGTATDARLVLAVSSRAPYSLLRLSLSLLSLSSGSSLTYAHSWAPPSSSIALSALPCCLCKNLFITLSLEVLILVLLASPRGPGIDCSSCFPSSVFSLPRSAGVFVFSVGPVHVSYFLSTLVSGSLTRPLSPSLPLSIYLSSLASLLSPLLLSRTSAHGIKHRTIGAR
jgi:hypothetical protein